MEINDIITQLIKEKEILQDEINQKQARLSEIETTIKSILSVLTSVEVICDNCNGTGQKFHRSCAEDDGEYQTCSKCKGYGKIPVYSKK
jgi:predicted nuclease with TOPRIM domain